MVFHIKKKDDILTLRYTKLRQTFIRHLIALKIISTSSKMGSLEALTPSVEDLRASLRASKVLTPGSPGYEESLHRWSEAAEKRAVRQRSPRCLQSTSADKP